jgi:hypothetical protein
MKKSHLGDGRNCLKQVWLKAFLLNLSTLVPEKQNIKVTMKKKTTKIKWK